MAALALVLAVLALGMLLAPGLGPRISRGPRALLARLAALGPWGPPAFVALYAACTVALVPGSLLTLGAGAVFGPAWGALWASAGSLAGATLAFLAGRGVAGPWVRAKVGDSPRLEALSRALGREGFKVVALLRLSPIFPFCLLNYALSLTPVRLKDYVLASWLGMLPGTLMYVYLGYVAGGLARLGGVRAPGPARWVLWGLGLAATLALGLVAARLARQALASVEGRDSADDLGGRGGSGRVEK